MAPEQHGGVADARSDIFSLGVLAYELLTGGRHPLGADRGRPTDADWAAAKIPPPSAFCALTPGSVDRLVLQMLRHDPAQRPTGAREIVRVIRAAIDAPDAEAGAEDATEIATVDVPAGVHVVGSPPNAAYAAEKPMRRIRLPAYRIGRRPVTNAQYLAFCRATGARPPALIEDPVFGAPNHPVVMVGWRAAAAFAEWAGGRLPREAEWEAAAKAGAVQKTFPWGDDAMAPERANADGAVGHTTAVGAYPLGASALGVEDMAGNVWEWCADAYDERAYRAIRDGEAPPAEATAGAAPGAERVLRGGAFDALPAMCRCAFRHRAPPTAERNNIGFRIAFDADAA